MGDTATGVHSPAPLDFSDPRRRRRHYIDRHQAIVKERESYIEHWKDISNYLFPRRGRYLVADRNKGGKRNQHINDNTGTRAHRTLAAGMMSGITSPARPWFRLETPDPDMMEFAPVKQWLFEVEAVMRQVFARSNLYNALHGVYEELGAFGTAASLIEEDFHDVARAYTLTAGEYGIALSERLHVNTLTREFSMTVWQLAERFGKEALARPTRQKYDRGEYDKWVRVLHVIQPNVAFKEGAPGWRGKRFVSVYIDLDADDDVDHLFLSEGGYNESPVLAPRWTVIGTDVYGGACPGMDSLGDVKQLQHEQKRKAQGIDKMVDPPLVAPIQLKSYGVSTLPGGVNFADPTMQQGGFGPLYEVRPDLGHLTLDIQETQNRIRDTFYEDLFRMFAFADDRRITATEVIEKREEKLLMLGPVLERLHNELLDPLIDRVFAVCLRAGLFPPPPDEIAGAPLRVEYISILAQAQRAVGVSSIERLSGFITGLAQFNPDVLMKFDMDQAVDEYAEMLGAPPKIVLPDEVVERKRQERDQLAAREQQIAETAQAAQTAKDLSQASTGEGEEDNLLNDYLAGIA